MSDRVFERPDPLELAGGVQYTVAQLIGFSINNDERFNATGKGIRAAARIEQAIEKNEPAIVLRDDDWALLKDALETPHIMTAGGTRGLYEIGPARKLVPLIDAVVNAAATH